jgi:hypothetical protein
MTSNKQQIMITAPTKSNMSFSTIIKSLPRMGLLLSILVSIASAFHTGSISRASIVISRSYSTENSNSNYLLPTKSSPTSLTRVKQQHQQQHKRSIQQQLSSTSTRLQFSDLEDNPNTTIEQKWWRKLISYPRTSTTGDVTKATTTYTSRIDSSPTADNGDNEQDNVDAYLEFLDRRYRRLHSDDREEEVAQQQAQVKKNKTMSNKNSNSDTKKSGTFSAIDWLVNGGNNGSDSSDFNVVAASTTRQQQADALYVLGVAGLASQKLLHKHHLPTSPEAPTIQKVVELSKEIDDVYLEEKDMSQLQQMKNQLYQFAVNNIIVPLLRIVYLVQRQKQLLKQMIQKRINTVATKAASVVLQTVQNGPKSLLNTLLNVTGGKQNIVQTIAYGSATILIFRPLFYAIFFASEVSPSM